VNASNTPKENDLDVSPEFKSVKSGLKVQEHYQRAFGELTQPDTIAKARADKWKEQLRKSLRAKGVTTTTHVGVIVDTLYRLRRTLQKTITREKIIAVQQELQDPRTHLLHVAGSDKWDPRELQKMIFKDLPAAIQAVRTVGLYESFFDKRGYPKDMGDTNPNHMRRETSQTCAPPTSMERHFARD
jgi:hypothetical protein